MNTVRQANQNTRFAKIMGRVAFWSATAGLLAYTLLLWQWAYYFPAQTEPRHGVPSGSMSGVGIKEIIGGIIFWLLLINMNAGLSLPIVALTLASTVSIVSTTIALILVGPRQCKLAWVSLCIFLNTCLLAFLVLDHGNLSYWPHLILLLLVSYGGFGLSVVGGLGTVLCGQKTVSHEEKVGRLLQQFAAGGFLLGIVSFVVFAIANLFWE
jgi:hypothetical protein